MFLHDFGTKSRFSFGTLILQTTWFTANLHDFGTNPFSVLGSGYMWNYSSTCLFWSPTDATVAIIMHCSHGQKNYGNMSIEKLSPFQETNNYGNGHMPRSTLTWKKYIWKFNCSTSRPFQKGSVYKVLPIFEVCIFISKTELWKNTAPARRSCLLAHVEPFFHFQNSVGDCRWSMIAIFSNLRIESVVTFVSALST